MGVVRGRESPCPFSPCDAEYTSGNLTVSPELSAILSSKAVGVPRDLAESDSDMGWLPLATIPYRIPGSSLFSLEPEGPGAFAEDNGLLHPGVCQDSISHRGSCQLWATKLQVSRCFAQTNPPPKNHRLTREAFHVADRQACPDTRS